MAHNVKCVICNKTFDRDKIQAVKVSARRYAHHSCKPDGELVPLVVKAEDPDLTALKEYAKTLLGDTYVPVRVNKQIKDFKEQYNYTYSGMLKALIYFYEVKGNSVEKANGGIGIIPWIYKDAYNYYYNLWMIKQRNEDKNISLYVPQVQEITIPIPQRKPYKKNLFSFLDEEEGMNGI